jgi:NTE family protein
LHGGALPGRASQVVFVRPFGTAGEDQLSDDERQLKAAIGNQPEIAILQLIYQQKAYEGDAKDHEFSGTSMREHWMSGHVRPWRVAMKK